jgi:hypothetical protein
MRAYSILNALTEKLSRVARTGRQKELEEKKGYKLDARAWSYGPIYELFRASGDEQFYRRTPKFKLRRASCTEDGAPSTL